MELTNRGTARAVARRAGVVAKGKFSQNFLIDRAVVDDIIDALNPGDGDQVLEIGPGLGVLTKELTQRAGQVVAVDIDPACIRATEIAVRGASNVRVVEGDARDIELSAYGFGDSWLCVGNLPYHITGALLSAVLEKETPPVKSVFMVQREVARRLAADQGQWSLATVAVRSLADVEIVRDVPPTSFDPAPKVYSSIIRVTPTANPLLGESRRSVIAIAKKAFQMRRKTLRHALANALGGDEQRALEVLSEAGIDPSRRPGTLNLEEWRRLAQVATERNRP